MDSYNELFECSIELSMDQVRAIAAFLRAKIEMEAETA